MNRSGSGRSGWSKQRDDRAIRVMDRQADLEWRVIRTGACEATVQQRRGRVDTAVAGITAAITETAGLARLPVFRSVVRVVRPRHGSGVLHARAMRFLACGCRCRQCQGAAQGCRRQGQGDENQDQLVRALRHLFKNRPAFCTESRHCMQANGQRGDNHEGILTATCHHQSRLHRGPGIYLTKLLRYYLIFTDHPQAWV